MDTLEQPLSETELVVNFGAESTYSSDTFWITEEPHQERMSARGKGAERTKPRALVAPPSIAQVGQGLNSAQNAKKLHPKTEQRAKCTDSFSVKTGKTCHKSRSNQRKTQRQERKETLSCPSTGSTAFPAPPCPELFRDTKSAGEKSFEDMSGYSDTKLANGAAQQPNGEVAHFHQADWEFQVRQFQRFLRWQHYQQMAHEQRLEDQATLCGMFRVLAQFIHALGTLLLVTGLICQLLSIVSSKWISHFLTADANVIYYEGLWHRCTQQAATPIPQWACWNWRGFSSGQAMDENSTPVSVLGARVLLISAIICSSLGSALVWLACKCSVLVQDGAKPCILLLTGALACISGILSGTGVTWRAIQVLKMSNSFYNQETVSNSNDELAISFDSGVWFGWASMVFLVIAGVILALASRLLQPRRSYPLHSTITQPVSRYTEYL